MKNIRHIFTMILLKIYSHFTSAYIMLMITNTENTNNKENDIQLILLLRKNSCNYSHLLIVSFDLRIVNDYY